MKIPGIFIAAGLLCSLTSGCSYYHTYSGGSYLLSENKALNNSIEKYPKGVWFKKDATAEDKEYVKLAIRKGYLPDMVIFLEKFGASNKIKDVVVQNLDAINILMGPAHVMQLNQSKYYCSMFKIQDENNQGNKKWTPIFIERDKLPTMANSDKVLNKKMCDYQGGLVGKGS